MLSEKRRQALKLIADRHQIDIRWPEPSSGELDNLSDDQFQTFLTETFEPRLSSLEAKEISLLVIQGWFEPRG